MIDVMHPASLRARLLPLRTSHRAVRLVVVIATTMLLALPLATPAVAHARLRASDPRSGAVLATAPTQIRLTFSEAPARTTVALVRDGCGRDVTSDVSVKGQALLVETQPGQPGRWSVAVAVLSGADGHSSDVDLTFTVTGDGACTSASPAASAPASPDTTSNPTLEPATAGASPAAGKSAADGGGVPTGLWVLGAGAAGALAGAVLVRARTRATRDTSGGKSTGRAA
jgi:methionine-rich copper-binding protein CopC